MKKKILCFILAFFAMFSICASTVSAESQLYNVTDAAGLLSESEMSELENEAEAVSARYGVGVYIVTIDDYHDYSPDDVFTATYGIYHEYTMGEGENRDGIMLLLSMANRDWAMFVYGENAEYAFNEYGQEKLEEVFLDDFAENDWYDGFEDYIEECDTYLQKAAAGKPVHKSPVGAIIFVSLMASFIAFIAVGCVWSSMKNVAKKKTANSYISGEVILTGKSDNFTHRTVTRHKIESSSSSSGGSRSHSGGGGLGRSGKF